MASTICLAIVGVFALAAPSMQSPIAPRSLVHEPLEFHVTEPLQFNENGSFQVAIFEDLHFGESELASGKKPSNANGKTDTVR
jgi:hypothetical protein